MAQLSPSEFTPIHAQGDTSESEKELSFPERFPDLAGYFGKENDITYSLILFDYLPDRNRFEHEWKYWDDKKSRKDLLDARTMWVAMKSQGEDFVAALENWVRQSLGHAPSRSELEFDLYQFIHIYHSLETPSCKDFYGDLLGYPAVWNWPDGSTLHYLLEHLREYQDSSLAPRLLALIDNMLLPGYKREFHLESDLYTVVGTLVAVAGDQAFSLLEARAEQDKTFAGYWEKIKLAYQSKKITDDGDYSGKKKAKSPPNVFDAEAENAYLERLTKELEEQPEKSYQSELSAFDHDEIFPSGHHDNWDDMADSNDNEGNVDDEEDTDVLAKSDEKRTPYKKRTINFYGRFRPHVEHSVALTEENTIKAVCGMLATPERGNVEGYLNIFSGVAEEGEIADSIPEKMSEVDFDRLASIVYARIILLATVDQDMERARSLFDQLSTFVKQTACDSKEIKARWARQLLHFSDNFSTLRTHEEEQLPDSAKPFFVYHQQFDKMREIPAFTELLAEKIRYLAAQMTAKGSSGLALDELIQAYRNQTSLYQSIEREDVPVYFEAEEKLDEADAKRLVVFGRDGKYLFTALKASDFGVNERTLKYVLVTRNIEQSESKATIARYLKEHGVDLDFHFLDTGYSGSIPELAIRSLADAGGVEISSEEIDKRVKLLSSTQFGRQSLAAQRERKIGRDPVEIIENRPLPMESPFVYQLSPDGKLVPKEEPTSLSTQLSAWVVEHAVMRNFAPRFDVKERTRRSQPDELLGYTFVERFYAGNTVATHPMELWKSPNEEKVLLKSGPEHTLRADYVGSRLFSNAGLRTPHAELLRKDGEIKMKMEYLGGWEDGPIALPERLHHDERIQEGFFIDLLLQQYDRVSWNMMFLPDEKGVAFIDNGASLHSRARGGVQRVLYTCYCGRSCPNT